MEDWELFPDFENPFTYEFYLKQLKFYGPITPAKIGPINYDTFTSHGIIKDYFNENWYEITDPIPRLTFDDEKAPWVRHTWMSIVPMEIQSMALAVYKAQYDVYTSGLGMGYYPLACAAKDDVEKVVVYETKPEVVQLFMEQHYNRPELAKIEIRQGDFLEALRHQEIDQDDYIFSDIYQAINSDEALDHLEEFRPEYPNYDFWGIEKFYLDAIATHDLYPGFMPPLIRTLFKFWKETTVEEATGLPSSMPTRRWQFEGEPMIHNMYFLSCTLAQCQRFIEILDESGT